MGKNPGGREEKKKKTKSRWRGWANDPNTLYMGWESAATTPFPDGMVRPAGVVLPSWVGVREEEDEEEGVADGVLVYLLVALLVPGLTVHSVRRHLPAVRDVLPHLLAITVRLTPLSVRLGRVGRVTLLKRERESEKKKRKQG